MLTLDKINNENLEEACKIADGVFPYVTEKPSYFLKESLKTSSISIESEGQTCDYIQYYAAVLDGKVIGTTGLYHLENEPDTTTWLGWFCISPKYRGHGYATKVLQKTIDIAIEEGKKEMRLYTSDRPNELAAQSLYEKMGLKIYKKVPEGKFNCIYRKREL